MDKRLLIGHRRERFRYELLNKREELLGELTTVSGGDLEFSLFTQIRSGGRVNIVEHEEIDYLSDRIRIFYELWDGSQWLSAPMGIYLPASPRRKTEGVLVEREVDVYDKTVILVQARVDNSWIVPSGSKITDAVEECVRWAEGDKANISITESDQTLLHDMIWPPGTPIIQVINDLLSSIDYFPIWADENGAFRAEPYIRPGDRSPVWEFTEGEESVHLKTIDQNIDFFNVPNVVILVSSGIGEEEEPLISKVYNTDPNSPFSIPRRGRMIVDFREEEAASQEVLDAKVERIMQESLQIIDTIEIQHPWLPIGINDAILVSNPSLGLNRVKFAVVRKEIPLKAGELTRTSARRTVMTG